MQGNATPGWSGEDASTTAEGGFHDPDSIVDAYGALGGDEKRKLLNVEGLLRGGTSFGDGELFREALTRAILGERRWPEYVALIAFLIMTMRSIASHERARLGKLVSIDDLMEGEIEKGVSSGGSPPTPEEQVMSAETVSTIHSHFEDDEQALLLLMGWGDGLRGKELREFVGMDQDDLDYLSKRVRRTLRRAYPNGWGA